MDIAVDRNRFPGLFNPEKATINHRSGPVDGWTILLDCNSAPNWDLTESLIEQAWRMRATKRNIAASERA
ncbi:hypothetical protein BH18ACT5_BH18ACT5_13600 [soil metagenome]